MTTFVDLFCGAGFGARGAVQGGGIPLLGLDVWELATRTYKANFPDADIITERIEDVDIPKLGKQYRPDVLLTSPECTSHSIARGSKPGLESSRETAIGIIPWVEALTPRWLIVENVNRMKKWDRHDELVQTIEKLGYRVSDLLLNSADFGSAQARKRMFLICDRQKTSVNEEGLKAFGNNARLTANDIIDWKATYPSTPLHKAGRAKATLERAERAITELGPNKPFIIVYYGSDYAGGWQPLTAPLRTVTTVDRFALVTWRDGTPYMRMLQPQELMKAMSSHQDHQLPFGTRRNKVKLCGNGVCSDVMTAIFRWIAFAHQQATEDDQTHKLSAAVPA
ncbi:DNA cytosine methyltransferase [Chromobacterium sinusclupearum]|uniref:DNA (cytosine-5-)-methyltransferase n=1 Tax=Chromobacterium sinusclupearum TaxID=2077146 RepID=A0A2K4MTF9_9NEIS|nr:DNA cytosine methyltransferase [Chromobacterium sinusclupearum]POB00308.1 DNA cytosine methyltransferase [Chromobacterium sinusclupearum]